MYVTKSIGGKLISGYFEKSQCDASIKKKHIEHMEHVECKKSTGVKLEKDQVVEVVVIPVERSNGGREIKFNSDVKAWYNGEKLYWTKKEAYQGLGKRKDTQPLQLISIY